MYCGRARFPLLEVLPNTADAKHRDLEAVKRVESSPSPEHLPGKRHDREGGQGASLADVVG
jgi:hypothetical protein